MVTGVKFSQLPNAGAPAPGSIVAGLSSGSNVKYTIPGATSQSATPLTIEPRVIYYATNESMPVVFNLPTSSTRGDVFTIKGVGAGGWRVQCGAGQTIKIAGASTSSGGSLASTSASNCLVFTCSTDTTTFTADPFTGILTIV